MSVSNVQLLSISITGISVPTTSEILAGVLTDWNTAFGGNLNIANRATPQGYICSQISNYLQNQNAALTYLANQTDPATAEGRFQDAIGRLNNIIRSPSTPTVVTCTVIGQPGQTLPAGSSATDGTYIYESLSDVVYATGGTASVQFACTTTGVIACPATTLNQIAIAAPYWDSVNNPSDGVIGTGIQSTYDFETLRQASLGKNSSAMNAAVRGAVLVAPGVIDCYVTDNYTASTVTVGATSYSMSPNSIYIGVYGGAEADIANAIFAKRNPGCNMNGNTTATVYDESLDYPYPSYSIIYNAVSALPIYFAVVVANHPGLPSNYVALVQQAIIASFNGQDGQPRAKIANDIYASRFYANISSISGVRIKTLLIGTTSSPTANELQVGIDQMPTIETANITVSAA